MKQYYKAIILFLLVLIELLSSTYWTQYMYLDICRYVHFFSGVLIAVLIFVKDNNSFPVKSYYSKWALVLLILLICWSTPKLYQLFIQNIIDYKNADMLPVIQVMAERWLSFQSIYENIPEIWGGVMPIYLPALYLAYVPALFLDFDMRWIGYAFVLIPIAYIFLKQKPSLISLSVFIPLGLFIDYVLHIRNESFVLSEEGVVYGYYMLLVYFLYKRNLFGIGITAACCLLSRYSGVFFIAALLPCFYLIKEVSSMKKYFSIGLVSGLILMTIGRAWSYFPKILSLSQLYVDNVMNNISKYQSVLNDGLGMMPLIGIQHTRIMYYVQIVSVIAVAACMIFFVKKYFHRFYFIAFLKISLVFFYNFLILPYAYLMYTSVFVSFIIFYLYTSQDENTISSLETE